MSGHTPGPWKAGQADMFGDHNITLADDGADARAVAAVVSNMRSEDEVAANARLIAAAPEMLEALLAWRHYHRDESDSLFLNYDHALDLMSAVLAKVDGRAS